RGLRIGRSSRSWRGPHPGPLPGGEGRRRRMNRPRGGGTGMRVGVDGGGLADRRGVGRVGRQGVAGRGAAGSPPRVAGFLGAEAVFRPRPEGAESDAVLGRYGVAPGSRFLLYVGGLSPHKNLPRLIEAFARADLPDVRLVLVGDFNDVFHTHEPALRGAVEE